ncbi:MAG: hypothetical protein M3O36_07705 [Myxococcota bacterium]|nr:hypothetical protein [Myxococcota bacterium]
MNPRPFASLPLALCLTSALGCTVQTGQAESTDVAADAVTACPTPSAQDDQMRAAATVAYRLMKGAADQVNPALQSCSGQYCVPKNNVQSTSILAPQRYRLRSSGTGIEFDPSDPLYGYVTSKMSADLAFAQLDASVAAFLAGGLKAAYAAADGTKYPHILSLPALNGFSFRHSKTTHIRDGSSQDNSHYATVTSAAWCGTEIVTITETVDKSFQFAPLEFDDINMWGRSRPPQFTGKSNVDAKTPFNGPSGGNPYLVVSIDGHAQAFYNYPYVNCWNNQGFACSSTIQIDPIPYSEPGSYYNNVGAMGTQANPFTLSNTVLYADPSHAGEWASGVSNGVQEWGTFSNAVTLFGSTKYKYVKRY